MRHMPAKTNQGHPSYLSNQDNCTLNLPLNDCFFCLFIGLFCAFNPVTEFTSRDISGSLIYSMCSCPMQTHALCWVILSFVFGVPIKMVRYSCAPLLDSRDKTLQTQ